MVRYEMNIRDTVHVSCATNWNKLEKQFTLLRLASNTHARSDKHTTHATRTREVHRVSSERQVERARARAHHREARRGQRSPMEFVWGIEEAQFLRVWSEWASTPTLFELGWSWRRMFPHPKHSKVHSAVNPPQKQGKTYIQKQQVMSGEFQKAAPGKAKGSQAQKTRQACSAHPVPSAFRRAMEATILAIKLWPRVGLYRFRTTRWTNDYGYKWQTATVIEPGPEPCL